jgi:hypothetical protein
VDDIRRVNLQLVLPLVKVLHHRLSRADLEVGVSEQNIQESAFPRLIDIVAEELERNSLKLKGTCGQ